MSRENVEIVRGVVERFMATGDVTWDVLDEDLEVHDHDILDGRDYRGHTGFGLWLDDWAVAWADWSYDAEEFIDAGDHVVVVIRMKVVGRSSGGTSSGRMRWSTSSTMARSRGSITTTADSKPSKPLEYRSRRCRRRTLS